MSNDEEDRLDRALALARQRLALGVDLSVKSEFFITETEVSKGLKIHIQMGEEEGKIPRDMQRHQHRNLTAMFPREYEAVEVQTSTSLTDIYIFFHYKYNAPTPPTTPTPLAHAPGDDHDTRPWSESFSKKVHQWKLRKEERLPPPQEGDDLDTRPSKRHKASTI